MDYTYDEQQADVRDLTATILGKAATPERLAALEADGQSFDPALWRDLARAGLVGVALPEDHGGGGAGFVELCIVVEAAARAAAPVHLCESVVLGALPVSRFGTPEQATRVVAPFAAGDLLLTSALGQVPGTSPPLRLREAGGGWAVDGAVSHVPLADVAERVLVEAVDDHGRRALLLVAPRAEGARLGRQSSVDRRARWQVGLDGYVVPEVDVVIRPGELGPEASRWIEDRAVAARCVAQLGSAEAALALTAAHVSERRQFGRPLGTFQAVSHRVADAYVDVDAVRLTAWRAAWLLDRETRDGDPPDREALAIAAWWAADAPYRVAEAAMQLHGGLGVDLDYPLHRHFLAIRQGELALGGPARRLRDLGDLMAVA